MPTVLLVAFALLALPAEAQQSLAPRAQAQSRDARFQGFDRNNDGVITRDEWRGTAQSFRVHDWNGDGILSGDEIRVGARRGESSLDDFDPANADQFTNWTEAGFTALDRNRDGRIAASEWRYDTEGFYRADRNRDGALSRAEFLGTGVDDDRNDRFEYLDANRNGRIEQSEWHGSADAFEWLDRNKDGTLSRSEVVGGARANRADRFTSLDFNGDGVISPDEWQWSRRNFNERDVNGDGVLSRREVLNTAEPAAVPTTGQSVVVSGTQGWTDTGLTVRAGDTITFDAQGSVQMSADANDVASPAGAKSGRRAPDAPLRQHLAGGLIGRVGDATLFFVGDQRSVRAPASGRLYLGINDDHLSDNNGEFRVTVAVQPR